MLQRHSTEAGQGQGCFSIPLRKLKNNINIVKPAEISQPIVELSSQEELSQGLAESSSVGVDQEGEHAKAKNGPNRCNSCRKRIGLMGFNCCYGNTFCPFDYRAAGWAAIEKAVNFKQAEKT